MKRLQLSGIIIIVIALLSLAAVTWMKSCDITPRLQIIDTNYARPIVFVFLPYLLLTGTCLALNGEIAKKTLIIITVVCLLPAVLLTSLLLCILKTDYYYVGTQKRLDLSYGDQGALGAGPYLLYINKPWGPLFYKQQSTQIEGFPDITQQKNGNTTIKYLSNGKKIVTSILAD